jgi:hypothetical protein
MQTITELRRPSAAATTLPIGRGHEDEPLRGYLTVTALFLTATTFGLARLRRSRGKIPRANALDLFVLSTATSRLSRLVSRDKVMSPVRAPFTEVERDKPGGEVRERPRGSGAVRAVGELLTCPRCTAMWASSALCMTYFWAPDVGRSIGLILSSAAVSDLTNRAFAKLG